MADAPTGPSWGVPRGRKPLSGQWGGTPAGRWRGSRLGHARFGDQGKTLESYTPVVYIIEIQRPYFKSTVWWILIDVRILVNTRVRCRAFLSPRESPLPPVSPPCTWPRAPLSTSCFCGFSVSAFRSSEVT